MKYVEAKQPVKDRLKNFLVKELLDGHQES
jgi:hypothetical protein